MVALTLSQTTQNAINRALSNGTGAGNQNYIAAYQAIAADINAYNANPANASNQINSGTAYWFNGASLLHAQATEVKGEMSACHRSSGDRLKPIPTQIADGAEG